jgi:hypothetical protein
VLQAAERILQRDVCGLVILDQDGTVPERATRLGSDWTVPRSSSPTTATCAIPSRRSCTGFAPTV